MKVSYIAVFLLLISLSVRAQQGEVRQLGTFQGIKVSEGVDVYLKKGDKESARIEVSGMEASNVLTEVTGATLRVHLRDQHYVGRKTARVYVTYVRIEKITANSAANVFSETPVKTDNLSIAISSAASVEIAVEAESVTVEASSAGNGVLEGKTNLLEITVSSAGDIDAYRLEGEKVYVRANSAGTAKVNAVKELEAHANSAGMIRYHGNPTRTNTDSNSGGSVKKTN
jgi:hypothetical protein